VADLLDVVQADSMVRKALSQLTRQQRELVGLAFLGDLSHQQIAHRTGLPLGTIKSHIRRGLLALRQSLEDQGYEP
jgi:RNA polymerase sigma-70 factor (ECF subfamily)